MSRAFPVLYARDPERVAGFYRELLGFAEIFRMPDDGPAGYIGLQLEDSRLGVVDNAWPLDQGIDAGDKPRGELFVYVDDVDASVQTVRDAGATVIAEPVDQPWGERVAYVADPEGGPVALAAPLAAA